MFISFSTSLLTSFISGTFGISGAGRVLSVVKTVPSIYEECSHNSGMRFILAGKGCSHALEMGKRYGDDVCGQ
nr:hypothetical protein [uncultured Prevotella sp.]